MFDEIISFASMVISLMTFLLVSLQTTKNWYVNIVTAERLAWAENVRKALVEYIEAYYDSEIMNLKLYENKILIYLNSERRNANPEHIKFVNALRAVTERESTDIDSLIKASQTLLNWNWRETKKESSTIFRSPNVPK